MSMVLMGGGVGAPPNSLVLNSAPAWVDSIPTQSAPVSQAYSLDLTTLVSDPEGDFMAFSVDSGALPAGLNLSGDTISGTPTVEGSQTVVIGVTDNISNGAFLTSPIVATSDFSAAVSSFSNQIGTFTAQVEVTPVADNIDLVVALSEAVPTAYSEMLCICRFNSSGQIDARNDASYSADSVLNYAGGTTYQVKFIVDGFNATYSVEVDGQRIATDYAFRDGNVIQLGLDTLSAREAVTDGSTLTNGRVFRPVSVPIEFDVFTPDTTPPPAPDAPTLTNDTNGVRVTFPTNTASDHASYAVLRSTDDISYTQISSGQTGTFYTDTSTVDGTLYYYALTAIDASGNVSAQGSSASITYTPQSSTGLLSSVTREGITWTFDQAYPVGQFCNGDFYVVIPNGGSVTVNSVSPGWTGQQNGSMLNVTNTGTRGSDHSFDSRETKAYNAGLQVSFPLSVSSDNTLLSSISNSTPVANGSNLYYINTVATLTFLTTEPAAGSFRPPMQGTDKTIIATEGDIDFSYLQNRAKVASSLTEQEFSDYIDDQLFGRTKTFIKTQQNCRYTRPVRSLGQDNPYGRNYAKRLEIGLLAINCDYSFELKRKAVIGYIQMGIDIYGAIKAGGYITAQGGLNNGSKVPMLMAGVMLNNTDIKNYANATYSFANYSRSFHEDEATFVVQQSDVGRTVNSGHSTYSQGDVGNPEWGEQHYRSPQRDDSDWGATYRDINTAAFIGHCLSALMMGMKADWGWDVFFDYCDRAFSIDGNYTTSTDQPGTTNGMTVNAYEMWLAYRNDY